MLPDSRIAGFSGNFRFPSPRWLFSIMATQHVLIKLLEEWKSKLDNITDNFIVGSVLMDLSKAFDCIPHNLIIAKLHAYGFDENSLVLSIPILKNGGRVSKHLQFLSRNCIRNCIPFNNVYSSFFRNCIRNRDQF